MSIGSAPEHADEGAALILCGVKTLTSSPFWDYRERTVSWWRREMGAFYQASAMRHGEALTDETLLIWEWFAVVRRL